MTGSALSVGWADVAAPAGSTAPASAPAGLGSGVRPGGLSTGGLDTTVDSVPGPGLRPDRPQRGRIRVVRAGLIPGILALSTALLSTALLGTVLLGTVLLGTVVLGTVLLGTVLLGTVLLGTALLGTALPSTVFLGTGAPGCPGRLGRGCVAGG